MGKNEETGMSSKKKAVRLLDIDLFFSFDVGRSMFDVHLLNRPEAVSSSWTEMIFFRKALNGFNAGKPMNVQHRTSNIEF